ncbi:MAG: hypothetical protein VX438_01585 [Planctomycetota bacterium]|nr:hypothetical protein [Planctomycetota bacterium]
MQSDDRPDYPMAFVIEMDFEGQLRRKEFEDAVAQVLERHPLLVSSIELGRRDLPVWVIQKDRQPFISYGKETDPLDCPESDQFDNAQEAGIRIYVRQGEEKVRVSIYFDHKCTDGVGAHTVCGEIFAFYANAVEGKEVAKLIDLKPILLKTRQQRQLFHGGISLMQRPNWYAWKYAFKVAGFGCQPLAARRQKAGQQLRPRFGVLTDSLGVEEHRKLREAAIQHGVTVNDIVLTELFLTMCDWNRRLKKLTGRKFKILMPSNLRQRGDDEMPCTNMTTYNFLSRKPKQCRNRFEMVKSVRDDTNEIKTKNTGADFLEAAAKGYAYSWVMPFIVSKRTTLSTAVISNVGDPTRRYTCRIPRKKGDLVCGNLILEQIGGAPPLRPNTRSGWAITTYRRKLTVSVRFDPFLYDQDDADEIMAIFLNGLRAWFADRV